MWFLKYVGGESSAPSAEESPDEVELDHLDADVVARVVRDARGVASVAVARRRRDPIGGTKEKPRRRQTRSLEEETWVTSSASSPV